MNMSSGSNSRYNVLCSHVNELKRMIYIQYRTGMQCPFSKCIVRYISNIENPPLLSHQMVTSLILQFSECKLCSPSTSYFAMHFLRESHLLPRLILLGHMRIGSELWKVTGAMIRNLFPDLYISPFASPCNILCVNAPLPVGQYYVH